MALDFPRAWELARAAPAAAHHRECSYAQTGGALLCDLACPVITGAPEYRCPAMHSSGGKVIRDTGPYGKCRGHDHNENPVTASDSPASSSSTRNHGGNPVDITSIGTEMKDHIEQGQAWFTKVLQQHVPQLLAEGERLSSSPIVQALAGIVLPPETEQAIAGLISKFAAAYGTPAAPAAAPAAGEAPGDAAAPPAAS